MGHCGLFVGLTTLDLIYGVTQLPQANEKQVAADLAIAAGGPATNAAVTFRHLGNQAKLISAVGQHPLATLVHTDLATQQVELLDLAPQREEPPPLSSILVTQGTGDRAVVSRNAVNLPIARDQMPPNPLGGIDIVLIDGHQIEISVAIAQAAQHQNIPVVLDGGSWKPGLETALPFVDYAICAANFLPPGCAAQTEVMAYLEQAIASPSIAITRGGAPIKYRHQGTYGEILVPAITPIDTLGAGDVFHGAFCHWILQTSFPEALTRSAKVAASACQSFGTRQWLLGSNISDGEFTAL
jgi:sugar/nucleoside kinase (ribokinase family)